MQPPERSILVRLFIFSGRPDPEWPLAGEAIQELARRVKGSIGTEEIHPPPPGGLGYRGFLVRNMAQYPDLPAEFSVFRRVLTEQSDRRAKHWRDSTGVEAYLLVAARGQGFGRYLDEVRA